MNVEQLKKYGKQEPLSESVKGLVVCMFQLVGLLVIPVMIVVALICLL